MSRVICPNCGRVYQEVGSGGECPRCHYRAGGTTPAPPQRPAVAASTFSVSPPAPQPELVPPPPPQRPPGTNGFAVAALVLGIVGLMIWPLALFALIFGVIGTVQTHKSQQPGQGLAITGIVLGSLVILIGAIILAGLFIAFG